MQPHQHLTAARNILESALSEYGVISQIPIDRLTIMTTGRKGHYKTPYGTIEFTHR